jgi:hypothetical protein
VHAPQRAGLDDGATQTNLAQNSAAAPSAFALFDRISVLTDGAFGHHVFLKNIIKIEA